MAHRARELIVETRQEIAPVEHRIRQHPYLGALEARKVDRGMLGTFAGQQRHIIESDLRSVALIVARADSQAPRDFFMGMLQGERAALEALEAFGKALGISRDKLAAAEPLPGAFAYSAYVAWLALYGSAAEFAGAFLVNLEAWGANCGRMSRALQDRYGLTKQDVAFFDLFAAPPPGFEDGGLAVVDEGLAGGVDPARIRRAARLLQGYELLYWDTMLQAAEA
jgi:pyrroloquinoline quinone (PQQ) biosynthesis protein C